MEPRKRKRCCLARNCNMSTHSPNFKELNIKMFVFPVDTERCNAWLKLIGRSEFIDSPSFKRLNQCVCSLHFDESDLIKEVSVKLKPDAFPFLNLACEMPTTQFTAEHSDRAQSHADVTTAELRCATDYLETLGMKHSNTHLSDVFMIDNHQVEKAASGNFFPVDDDLSPLDKFRIIIRREMNLSSNLRELTKLRTIAINLLFSNPETYQFLQPIGVMHLPSIKSLSYACVPTPHGSGSDSKVLELLGISLQYMPVAARHCSLCITEYKLTPRVHYDITHDIVTGLEDVDGTKLARPAQVAVIAAVRGLCLPWLQPVSFCFLSNERNLEALDLWLTNLITKLQQIDLKVQAVIVPPTKDFYEYSVIKNISHSNPFVMDNVYFIFDAPQLIRRVRDIFMEQNIITGKQIAKFEHVQSVICSPLTPNLGAQHLEPSKNINSSKVTETLSRSVAAAISVYVDLKTLPPEARDTANFIETINDALDIVNQTNIRIKREELSLIEKKANHSVASFITQSCALDDPKEICTNMSITGQMFAITVASVSSIILIQSEDNKVFNAGHLNLEPLTKMLKKLKSYSTGSTCRQFLRSFRALCKHYLFVAKKPRLPHRENLQEFVERLDFLPILNPVKLEPAKSSLLLNEKIDYYFVLPVQDEWVFVAAYLLYKCYESHKCATFSNLFNSLQPVTAVKHFERACSSTPLALDMKVPKPSFNAYIRKLNSRFITTFAYCLAGRVGEAMMQELFNVEWSAVCICFPKQYLHQLFIRVRLYIALRNINKRIKRNAAECFFQV